MRRFVEACRDTRTILPATTTIERLCADALVDAERRIEARITERVPPGLDVPEGLFHETPPHRIPPPPAIVSRPREFPRPGIDFPAPIEQVVLPLQAPVRLFGVDAPMVGSPLLQRDVHGDAAQNSSQHHVGDRSQVRELGFEDISRE